MIINLTQHNATADQIAAGVVEPDAASKALIQKLLTFNDLPSAWVIEHRASALADLVDRMSGGATRVMIGGAPYLMGALERELKERGHRPVYAFSQRESVDQIQDDGTTRKVAIFRHLGFVEV